MGRRRRISTVSRKWAPREATTVGSSKSFSLMPAFLQTVHILYRSPMPPLDNFHLVHCGQRAAWSLRCVGWPGLLLVPMCPVFDRTGPSKKHAPLPSRGTGNLSALAEGEVTSAPHKFQDEPSNTGGRTT